MAWKCSISQEWGLCILHTWFIMLNRCHLRSSRVKVWKSCYTCMWHLMEDWLNVFIMILYMLLHSCEPLHCYVQWCFYVCNSDMSTQNEQSTWSKSAVYEPWVSVGQVFSLSCTVTIAGQYYSLEQHSFASLFKMRRYVHFSQHLTYTINVYSTLLLTLLLRISLILHEIYKPLGLPS